MIDAISEGVKANKKAYEQVEEAFEKAFQDMAKSSPSGSGNSGAR
ncbi:hypothetical protein ACH429_14390 [Streptomyces pathocidini]|uniref:Uncharacterized protein n=2 Tax=Streptomyces pathocidini TaxID=1650571 RepID=A0ABW7UV08_9ACTN|nr:hypothetical protein [Streptomyces pathocidini]